MAQISGQITVTTAGTAEAGPSTGPGVFALKYVPGNTGTSVYFGNDGSDDVTSGNGFPLGSGETIIVHVTDLDQVYFDVDTSGDKIAWALLSRSPEVAANPDGEPGSPYAI